MLFSFYCTRTRLFATTAPSPFLLGLLWPSSIPPLCRAYSSIPDVTKQRGPGADWTDKELLKLRDGVLNSEHVWQIAKDLPNLTYSAVKNKYTKIRQELGLSYKVNRWKREDIARLEDAKASGMSLADISKLFPDRDHYEIQNKLQRMKWKERAIRSAQLATHSEGAIVVDRRDRLGHKLAEIARDMEWTDRKTFDVYRKYKTWSPSAENKASPWTSHEEQQLLHLHEAGNSSAVIAETLGRAETAVRERLHRMYVAGRAFPKNAKWTREEKNLLKTLKNAGLSWSDIQAKLPHKTQSVIQSAWYRMCPGSKRLNPWSEKELHQLEQLRESGLSWEETSREMPNRSPASAKSALYRRLKSVKSP